LSLGTEVLRGQSSFALGVARGLAGFVDHGREGVATSASAAAIRHSSIVDRSRVLLQHLFLHGNEIRQCRTEGLHARVPALLQLG
jgi:hypothetical protein